MVSTVRLLGSARSLEVLGEEFGEGETYETRGRVFVSQLGRLGLRRSQGTPDFDETFGGMNPKEQWFGTDVAEVEAASPGWTSTVTICNPKPSAWEKHGETSPDYLLKIQRTKGLWLKS